MINPSYPLITQSIDATVTGTVITATIGKKICVTAVKLISSANVSVNWRDGESTDLEGGMPLIANSGYVEVTQAPDYLFKTTTGNSLDIVISGEGRITGRITYWLK